MGMLNSCVTALPGSTTTFENNTANYGGGISVYLTSSSAAKWDVLFEGTCLFRSNAAVTMGGAVYLQGLPDASVRMVANSTVFEYNSAEVAGGAATRLTDGPTSDAEPAWSPDGTRIAFTASRGRDHDLDYQFDVFVVEVATRGVTRITDGAGCAFASASAYHIHICKYSGFCKFFFR